MLYLRGEWRRGGRSDGVPGFTQSDCERHEWSEVTAPRRHGDQDAHRASGRATEIPPSP